MISNEVQNITAFLFQKLALDNFSDPYIDLPDKKRNPLKTRTINDIYKRRWS